mmetsp:Transcript_61708/g.144483  ORF Transcript_61708/g.144483 Transcript_61708/m.144483 type:complete len:583 (-) Transcript_61708:51-1799(-)
MDAMSSSPRQSEQLLVGFGLVMLTFHFSYNYSGLRCWLAQAAQDKQESALSESESLRVEEKLHEVRCKMFINWAQFGVHVAFVLVLVCLMDFYRAQSVLSCLWLLLGILAYGVYTVALWSSQVTEQILVRSCAVLHFTLLVGVLADTLLGLDDIVNRVGTFQYTHMILGVVFAPSKSTAFCSVCYFALCAWNIAQSSSESFLTPLCLLQQFFQAATGIGLPFIVDAVLRDWIAVSFRSKDSDSLIHGFRRMLKGIADGELLLDNGFRICGSAVCLQRLLETGEDFAGRSLEDLIDGEEARTKFRRSLTPQNAGSTQTLQTAPPCLRVPLKAPSGRVVSVDVCHVPLPNLYGTKTVHYLLSLTEDLDPRVPPMDLQEDSQQSRFKDQEGEVRSAQSAASSETHVEGYDELAEMTLLLNLTSELVDIEEAHLRFQRRTNEAEFRLGMPTLKRFARPLDWENLNGYLRHYARQVGKGQASEKQSLGSIMLRMPGESRKLLQARRATISSPYAQTPNQPARLFLHLANFKDKRPKNSRPRLAGLDENAKVDDEPRSAAINSASSGSQSSPQRLRESSGEELREDQS